MNPNKPNSETAKIPDIMSEQLVAAMLGSKERITERAQECVVRGTDANGDHVLKEEILDWVHAAGMAEEMGEYLTVVAGNLEGTGSVNAATYVRRLVDYAQQLQVLALCEIEGLTA